MHSVAFLAFFSLLLSGKGATIKPGIDRATVQFKEPYKITAKEDQKDVKLICEVVSGKVNGTFNISLDINYASSTALEGKDFIINHKTLTFHPNSKTAVSLIQILKDKESESQEVVQLSLRSLQREISIGSNNKAVIKIEDKQFIDDDDHYNKTLIYFICGFCALGGALLVAIALMIWIHNRRKVQPQKSSNKNVGIGKHGGE